MSAFIALKYCTYLKYSKYVPICCRVKTVEDLQ